MTRGAFLVLEGPEGGGKSTQAERLARRLEAAGHEVVRTREPGGTPVAQRVREVLLDPGLEVEPLAEFLLYAAARAQHVHELIRPALARGAMVVCDRFTASSVAYQGYGRGLELGFVRDLNARATGGLRPDLTVLFDLDPQRGLERAGVRGALDRLERADPGFHARVREGFQAEAARAGDWLVLDAERREAELEAALWAAVRARLPRPEASS